MGKRKRKRRQSPEQTAADLVEGLGLSDLYRLAGACADIGNRVSSVRVQFRDKPLDLGAVKEAFTPLRTALPQIDELIDVDAIAETAVAEHPGDRPYGWTLTDIAPDAVEMMAALKKAATHRIETEGWDRFEKAEGYLADYFCWNGIDAYIDEEALVYLRSRGRECRDDRELIDNVPIACAIVFASCRLESTRLNPALTEEALDFLQRTRSHSGGWPYAAHDTRQYTEPTAMAIHAIALAKPPGWERGAQAAAEWLWTRQEPFGHWWDEGAAGSSVHLTVLVLDAIELAGGGTQVTFRLPQTPDEAKGEEDAEETPAARAPVTPVAPAGHQWTETELHILEALHYAYRGRLETLSRAIKKPYPTVRDALRTGAPLRKVGLVAWKKGLGWFRTDAPPDLDAD